MLISGIKVNTIKHPTIIKINGIMPFNTTSSLQLPTRAATNKAMPNGGVIKPIARFVTIIKPKCTGSNPIDVATGKSIGAKIKIAGV